MLLRNKQKGEQNQELLLRQLVLILSVKISKE